MKILQRYNYNFINWIVNCISAWWPASSTSDATRVPTAVFFPQSSIIFRRIGVAKLFSIHPYGLWVYVHVSVFTYCDHFMTLEFA